MMKMCLSIMVRSGEHATEKQWVWLAVIHCQVTTLGRL